MVTKEKLKKGISTRTGKILFRKAGRERSGEMGQKIN